MQKIYCKKCNSTSLHIEKKGNNTGLYCNTCGSWIKWLSKDEVRAFEFNETRKTESDENSKTEDDFIKKELNRFIEYLDKAIDQEFSVEPLSEMDAIRKSSYCLGLERDKNALINILAGRKFGDYER